MVHGSQAKLEMGTTCISEVLQLKMITQLGVFLPHFQEFFKFYAWIPWENATSQSASYGIWTANGWVTVPINQQNYSDVWVPLGTYKLNESVNPSYNCVVLLANTSEPPGTKSVGVDAIKIRTYPVFLPIVV